MTDYEEGPVVQICRPSQVAATSQALGLPVSSETRGGRHDPRCGGCAGEKTSTDCPYSVRIQRYVDGLPYPPSQGGTDTRPKVCPTCGEPGEWCGTGCPNLVESGPNEGGEERG